MTERVHRSILKSISWRITGTFDTIVISYLITHRVRLALSIGLVELFTKCFLYLVHERVWNRVRFGRVNESLSESTRPTCSRPDLDPALSEGGIAA